MDGGWGGGSMGGVYSPVVAVERIWMEGGVEEVWGEYIALTGRSLD